MDSVGLDRESKFRAGILRRSLRGIVSPSRLTPREKTRYRSAIRVFGQKTLYIYHPFQSGFKSPSEMSLILNFELLNGSPGIRTRN